MGQLRQLELFDCGRKPKRLSWLERVRRAWRSLWMDDAQATIDYIDASVSKAIEGPLAEYSAAVADAKCAAAQHNDAAMQFARRAGKLDALIDLGVFRLEIDRQLRLARN
jgi:hypothetical protein